MPVDTSIYNAISAPPKSALDYANEFAKADSLRNQNALTGIQLRQAASVDEQRNALRGAVQSGQLDLSDPNASSRALTMAPDVAPALLKTIQDQRTSSALASKDTAQAGNFNADAGATNFKTKVAKANQAITDISNLGTPDDAVASIRQHLQNGDIDMLKASSLINTLQPSLQDPAQFAQWKRQMVLGIMDAKDRIAATAPKVEYQKAGGSLVPTQTNGDAPGGYSSSPAGLAPIPITQSADSIATNAMTRRGQDMTQQTQYTLAGLDKSGKDAGGGTGGLSPAAIENAAARYNTDGTLPPSLGRGQQGARDIRSIQNRAAELAMGTDPTQLRVNQLDAKSASSALTQLTKSQTMASSFENTANQNADLALSLSGKLPRTGMPLLNSAIQAVRTGTGSPEATQFAAANETFVNEYAKIMSGGMGNAATSDSASNRAHSLLSTAMTPQQYEGNVRLLQQEMRNRMKGYDDQVKAVKSRIGGKSSATPPAGAAGDADIHAAADKILSGDK